MKRGLLLIVTLIALTSGVRGESLVELKKAFESRDPAKREKAVGTLAKVPGKVALTMVLSALADEDAEVRSRARRGVLSRRTPEDLALIASRGTRHRDPRVRLVAYEALAAARAPDIEKHLESALGDSDPKVREAAVSQVIHISGGRGKPVLAAAVLRGREGRPRAAALLGLAGLAPEESRALAGKVLADRTMEARVAAMEVIGSGPEGEALAVLRSGLDDPNWSVRLTAVRLLAGIRRPEAIDALIGALGTEKGRMREEAGEALVRLTGVGFADDPEVWEKWWAGARSDFEFPEKRVVVRAEADASAATFHSVPFRSEGVAFVLDRSRSMRDHLDREEAGTKGELVETELERTLRRLNTPAKFLLVAFRTEPVPFTPRPVTASCGARQKAITWFKKLPPQGRTNLFDALAMTLMAEEIDTVFLLTDGAPSAGTFQSRTEILAEVARLNRYRKAAIHTIEIGGEATGKRWKGFLKELATANGGKHVRR
jgi:HEAT repeat protein